MSSIEFFVIVMLTFTRPLSAVDRKWGGMAKGVSVDKLMGEIDEGDIGGGWDGELDGVVSLLQSVAHQLANLRGVIHNLKIHNQLIYKHLHRMQKDRCHVTSSKKENWLPPEFAQVYQNYEAANLMSVRVSTGLAEHTKPSSSCPAGFYPNSETKKCYGIYSDQRVSWRVARDRCKSSGAELASVQSAREQTFISDLLRKTKSGKCDYWTGLTRRRTPQPQPPAVVANGRLSTSALSSSAMAWTGSAIRGTGLPVVTWYWSGDGSSLGGYTNWNKNEPNDGLADEACAQMLWIFDWKWNDAPCNQTLACFLCQTITKQYKHGSKRHADP